MKFIEIRGNRLLPVSNEEMLLIERVKGSVEPVTNHMLEDREREVARNLVQRGALNRTKIDGEICFVYNDLEDIWG